MNVAWEAVDVLGAPVACIHLQNLLDTALAWSGEPGQRTVFYVNAHVLNTALREPGLLPAWKSADLVYADGIGVVWAARWLYGKSLVKLTGADWIGQLATRSAPFSRRWFLLGGAPGVAELAGIRLAETYPGLDIVGSYYGYFPNTAVPAVLEMIRAARPDVVFVGLGTPRQELWLAHHRAKIDAPLCWAVGALFDYLAGVERRVPAWMNRLGLEWLFRLGVDPHGKWRRYLLGNPRFVGRVVAQKLEHRAPAARKG